MCFVPLDQNPHFFAVDFFFFFFFFCASKGSPFKEFINVVGIFVVRTIGL